MCVKRDGKSGRRGGMWLESVTEGFNTTWLHTHLYCRQFSRDVDQLVGQGVVNMFTAAQWVAHPPGFHQHVIGMDAATLEIGQGGGL